ncbi:hypothetical protein TorRG33x02_261950 [Trema orientale]|uniref:Uncharacterized protein n=1 Tax=Trema orientale TaxID=63057 RepID=A0A2P5D582_TREOI|nr:hypothetical protein TorRG33x02_261950 [Trema orientale]
MLKRGGVLTDKDHQRIIKGADFVVVEEVKSGVQTREHLKNMKEAVIVRDSKGKATMDSDVGTDTSSFQHDDSVSLGQIFHTQLGSKKPPVKSSGGGHKRVCKLSKSKSPIKVPFPLSPKLARFNKVCFPSKTHKKLSPRKHVKGESILITKVGPKRKLVEETEGVGDNDLKKQKKEVDVILTNESVASAQ